MLRVVTSCSAVVCEMAGEGEVSLCTTASVDDCDGGGNCRCDLRCEIHGRRGDALIDCSGS